MAKGPVYKGLEDPKIYRRHDLLLLGVSDQERKHCCKQFLGISVRHQRNIYRKKNFISLRLKGTGNGEQDLVGRVKVKSSFLLRRYAGGDGVRRGALCCRQPN